MTPRSLRYYWREHLATAFATSVAVMVLTGAFLVGDSVRGSLRSAFTGRLGGVDHSVLARHPFRQDLSDRLGRGAPVWRLPGAILGGPPVTVFGVDQRFFGLHGVADAGIGRGMVRVGPGIDLSPGDPVVLRVDDPSAVAAASLFGNKEGGITIRRSVEPWPDPAPGPASGDFALFPAQGATRAVFVGLDDLARVVGEPGRANALLIRGSPEGLPDALTLDDYGLSLEPSVTGEFVLGSRAVVLDDPTVAAARRAGGEPVLTYLATRMNRNPYSLVAGLPTQWLPEGEFFPGPWLADDLDLAPGDPVRIEFLRWEAGGYVEESVELTAGPAVSDGVFADGLLAPEVPGVSDSATIGDWNPPFPVDLSAIREKDEEYWDEHRALPKAFVPLPLAERLFAMREGRATSVRFEEEPDLLAELDPARFGLEAIPVREQGLAASVGATDFGAYFLYFSWFLLVSAFLLIGLLYRLGIERRLPEIGLLLASGWPPRRTTALLLREAAVLALAGAVLGAALGLGYGRLMVALLGGVFEGAIAGTLSGGGVDALRFVMSWPKLAGWAFGGALLACAVAWLTVRRVVRRAPRALLAGAPEDRSDSRPSLLGAVAIAGAVGLVGAVALGLVPAVVGFFGAGALFLTGSLLLVRAGVSRELPGSGLAGLGFRGLSFRPGRSLTAMALVGFASFTLVAVESFRKREDSGLPPGAGGFVAVAETVFGIPWDPATAEGRDALGIEESDVPITPLRIAGDEDASCLNLYQPDRPKVLGAPPGLVARFPVAAGDPSALGSGAPGDPIPVVGDQNSMTYVLKWRIGEERSFPIGPGGAEVPLVLVGTLRDSIFQSELLMAEEDFLRALPSGDGFRMFLATGGERAKAFLDDALADHGARTQTSRERLAEFHRVENAYLSTFQALGGLGLLLGVLGLIAVLLRNAHERRREWALLAAAGFRRRDFIAIGFWENAFVLVFGVVAGAASAGVAILPVLEREGFGGSLPLLAGLFAGVLGFGLLAGWFAARSVASRPIVKSLRAG